MALARREIRERHSVSATDFGVHLVNLAGESVRWKPLGHRVGIEERAINSLQCGAEHAVKSNRIGCHNVVSLVHGSSAISRTGRTSMHPMRAPCNREAT